MLMPQILVVEDDPATRKLYRFILRGAGYDVTPAASAEEALSHARKAKPDLVVMDMRLPDSDGLTLAVSLRRFPGWQDVPILAVSAREIRLEEARAADAPFIETLTKPVPIDVLTERVAAALGRDQRSAVHAQVPLGLRALLVDDDNALRYLLGRHLEAAGFDVWNAVDGEEALEAARLAKPDVVISDVMMPRMDGYQLCQAFHTDGELRDVPMILVSSAFNEREDRDLATGAGARDLIIRTPGCEEIVAAARRETRAEERQRRRLIPPTLDPDAYTERMVRQLELEAGRHEDTRRLAAFRAVQLSSLAGVAEVIEADGPAAALASAAVSRLLDTDFLSFVALYGFEDGEHPLLAAGAARPVARKVLESFFDHDDLLARVTNMLEPITVPSVKVGADLEASLLDRAGVTSLVPCPLRRHRRVCGVLVLGSDEGGLGVQALAFARSVAALIAPLAWGATRPPGRREELAFEIARQEAASVEVTGPGIQVAVGVACFPADSESADALMDGARQAAVAASASGGGPTFWDEVCRLGLEPDSDPLDGRQSDTANA